MRLVLLGEKKDEENVRASTEDATSLPMDNADGIQVCYKCTVVHGGHRGGGASITHSHELRVVMIEADV